MTSGKNNLIDYIHSDFLDKEGLIVSGYTLRGHDAWFYHSDDASSQLNYQALANTFGIPLTQMVRPWFKDTHKIRVVTKANGGEGILRNPPETGTDGLITDSPGLLLCAPVSDCPPLYLVDPDRPAIGLVHCSRKTIALGIVENAIQALHEEYGSAANRLKAAIGPHICGDCYKVSPETAAQFKTALKLPAPCEIIHHKGAHCYLDLGEAIKAKLLACKVHPENIFLSSYCNLHDQRHFYSYRGGDGQKSDLAVLLLKRGKKDLCTYTAPL